jgi:hypothetical protein
MSIYETSYAFGAAKSSIREIAAYGAARKAAIGAENVFDFSLGNPSIPAPDAVRASIERCAQLPQNVLHSYTPAAGLPEARQAVADSLNRRFRQSKQKNWCAPPSKTLPQSAQISLAIFFPFSVGTEIIWLCYRGCGGIINIEHFMVANSTPILFVDVPPPVAILTANHLLFVIQAHAIVHIEIDSSTILFAHFKV